MGSYGLLREDTDCRRTTCLKYLVLANMLMKSGINPFDSQETKPYKNDPEILAMTNLVRYWHYHKYIIKVYSHGSEPCLCIVNRTYNNMLFFRLWIYFIFCAYFIFLLYLFLKIFCSSYQNNDINEFEKILKTNRRNIMEDPFIREHIEGKHWRPFLYSFSHFLCTCYGCHINVKYMKGTTLLLVNWFSTCSLIWFSHLF